MQSGILEEQLSRGLERAAGQSSDAGSEDDQSNQEDREKATEQDLASADQTRALTEGIRQTHELRKRYSDRVFRFMVGWVVSVGSLVALDSCEAPLICADSASNPDVVERALIWLCGVSPAVEIEDSVMLAIVGSTTVSVLGLVVAVVKGLFPSQQP
ncbi:MAG: hypothetical protein OXH99_22240 [Bryobacterales bacterium]|nr:hypothetical protein [Bryobacterales bacterium]